MVSSEQLLVLVSEEDKLKIIGVVSVDHPKNENTPKAFSDRILFRTVCAESLQKNPVRVPSKVKSGTQSTGVHNKGGTICAIIHQGK